MLFSEQPDEALTAISVMQNNPALKDFPQLQFLLQEMKPLVKEAIKIAPQFALHHIEDKYLSPLCVLSGIGFNGDMHPYGGNIEAIQLTLAESNSITYQYGNPHFTGAKEFSLACKIVSQLISNTISEQERSGSYGTMLPALPIPAVSIITADDTKNPLQQFTNTLNSFWDKIEKELKTISTYETEYL